MQKGVFIPQAILSLSDLSWFERIVLAQVCYRATRTEAGYCDDTNEELATAIGCRQPKSISRTLSLLENSQLIRRYPTSSKTGKNRGYLPDPGLLDAQKKGTICVGTDSNSTKDVPPSTPTSNPLLPLPLPVEDPQRVEVGVTDGRGKGNNGLLMNPQRVTPTVTDGRGAYIRIEKELKRVKRKENTKKGCVPKTDDVAGFYQPQQPDKKNEAPAPTTNELVSKPVLGERRDPFFWKSDAESCNVPFSVWFQAYQKNTTRQAAMSLWPTLTNAERIACLLHTPPYVLATPNKQFRADAVNYLHLKKFNDEIIDRQPNGTDRKLAFITESDLASDPASESDRVNPIRLDVSAEDSPCRNGHPVQRSEFGAIYLDLE